MNKPARPRIDHGARGPAQHARPQRLVETIEAGVLQRVYADAHLIDRMHRAAQLSDKQHACALWVVERHEAAQFEPNVCAGYAPKGFGGGHDDNAPEMAAITRFRALLGGCSEAAAWVLHGMCLGQHPGVGRLASLQAALKDLEPQAGLR